MSVNKSVVRPKNQKKMNADAKAKSLVKKGFESKKVALRVLKKIERSDGRLSAANFVKSGDRAGLVKKSKGGKGQLKKKKYTKTKKESMKKKSSSKKSSSKKSSSKKSSSKKGSFFGLF